MNSAQIAELTRMVNEINQSAQQSANAGRIPGGAGLEQQSSANIGSALRGEVDPSTRYLLGQAAAERGVGNGNPMGANNDASYLQALGLTSFDRMNTGQGWLSAATARNPAAPIYDAGNQVTTAAQQLQAQLTREQMANAYRIAQLSARNSKGGGGGGTPSHPNIGTSAGNWQSVFGSGNSQGLDKFGRNMDAPGWSFPTGYWDIARPEGPPMGTENGTPFPWGTEGATGTTVAASTNFSSDMADFNDWFYRDGGGD